MAEPGDQDQRTVEPTPHRREEFRREGRVAISKDVISAAQLGAMVGAFTLLGEALYQAMSWGVADVMSRLGFRGGRGLELDEVFAEQMVLVAGPALAMAGLGAAAVLAAAFAQTRLLFAPNLIAFKWERVDPVQRIRDLFGPKTASMRLLLTMAKVGAAAVVMWLVVGGAVAGIAGLGLSSLEASGQLARRLLRDLLIGTAGLTGVVAVLDYVWQRRQLMAKMRMTPEEAKREHWEHEGKPEHKRRRRQMHRQLTLNRIIREVPRADVVVTNPMRLAIALRYRPGEDRAPVVTAKGADSLARHMRILARRHAVPIIEHKSLARTLWRKVKVGSAVPANLYQAVAEVLARVYRSRMESPTQGI